MQATKPSSYPKKRPEREALLGNTTKSRALEDLQGFAGRVDRQTGEISFPAGQYDPVEARLSRFALQSVVRNLLPDSRTAVCLRNRQKGKSSVGVLRSQLHGSTAYQGLQVCGSVWACPVCAAKIAERRRAEIQAAVAIHEAQGGFVLLLTLTNPHYASTRLGELLRGQRKAIHSFLRNKAGRTWLKSIGCDGHIRVLEVTHGSNGWHPHFHVLLFCRADAAVVPAQAGATALATRRSAYRAWANACLGAGLPLPSYRHGLSLEDGSKASRYVSKWGIEDEMTKGHLKKGRSLESESPFDLLRRVLRDKADRLAALLFREFADEFHGMRQLVWSRGLKKRFAVVDRDDAELIQVAEEDAVLLGLIELEDWRRVLRAEGRGVVLELARAGWDSVLLYLEGLKGAGVVRC